MVGQEAGEPIGEAALEQRLDGIGELGGDDVAAELTDAVAALLDRGLPEAVTSLLVADELEALLGRARSVVTNRRFPIDGTGRRYPWPLV